MSGDIQLDEIGARLCIDYISQEQPGVLFVWNTIECGMLEKNRALWSALWSGSLVIMEECHEEIAIGQG